MASPGRPWLIKRLSALLKSCHVSPGLFQGRCNSELALNPDIAGLDSPVSSPVSARLNKACRMISLSLFATAKHSYKISTNIPNGLHQSCLH